MAAPIGIRSMGDDSLRIANEAVEHWRAILSALSPVIGVHGVGALYRRTLFLTQTAHPWLEVPAESAPVDFEPLRSLLARRDVQEAAQARDALYGTFFDLLSSLIGASLAERLLPAGYPHPPPGAAAQDPLP